MGLSEVEDGLRRDGEIMCMVGLRCSVVRCIFVLVGDAMGWKGVDG